MAGPDANTYKYEHLTDEPNTHPIRLCQLAPAASHEEEIRCKLFNTTLDAKDDFEALSYTWGDVADTLPIFIDDKRFYVTRNLAVALRNLRHVDQERVMWIDAISINQRDVLERNQQVQQMKNIFGPGGARRVVVWLGVIPNARKAIDFCERMHFCQGEVFSWSNKCQKRRDARKQYGSKPMLEQPYDDEAAVHAAKELWTYMEVNKHSRDPLTYFLNQSVMYRGAAEMDENQLAEVRGHENFEFNESFLIDSSNGKRTAYEAARLLWNRMREPNQSRDDDPEPDQQQFEGDSGNSIALFIAQNPSASAHDIMKYTEAKREESSPGKDVWDKIQRNQDARQAARLLWEKIEEKREHKVMSDLQYELNLEHQEESKTCQYMFLDAPWWSRVWILQEVIHAGEVVVLLAEGGGYVSLEELLIAHDYWKTWQQLHNDKSVFTSTFASLRTRQQQFESKDADVSTLTSAWNRDQGGLNQAVRQLSRPPGPTEQDLYNTGFVDAMQLTDPRGHFKDLRAAAKAAPNWTGTMYPPNLGGLIMNFRNQHATDPRDKLYALMGMAAPGSQGTDIPVDYRVLTKELYIMAARALLKKGLLILLLVESPERAIAVDGALALPSWVPDHRTRQHIFPILQLSRQAILSADHGFPPVEQEPRFRQAVDAETLVLRGLYVGVVTSTFDARFTDQAALIGRDIVRLITYDLDPTSRYKTADELELAGARDRCGSARGWDRPDPVKDSSWGPVHTETGDSIIIVAGLSIPIVVRRVDRKSESRSEEKYLFVGTCWLVDSRVNPQIFVTRDWTHGSGFSPIMFGSALRGLPSDWKPEEFTLC